MRKDSAKRIRIVQAMHGGAVTLGEIAHVAEIRSISTVFDYLLGLEGEGIVTRMAKTARAVRLTDRLVFSDRGIPYVVVKEHL